MKGFREVLSAADHMIDWYSLHNPHVQRLRLSPADFAALERQSGNHGIDRCRYGLLYRDFVLVRQDPNKVI